MLDGAELIAAERTRQYEVEGWSPEHDAQHREGELLDAATAYLNTASALVAGIAFDDPPEFWPWAESWWKPGTDPVRTLVKAGALIAAEIDRLQWIRESSDV